MGFGSRDRCVPAPGYGYGSKVPLGASPLDLQPARRVRGKTTAVELASGASLLPGAAEGEGRVEPVSGALSEMALLAPPSESDADDESWSVVSDNPGLRELDVSLSSPSTTSSREPRRGAAWSFVEAGRYSMDDCLAVLESEPFIKTRKQRANAWGDNGPPPIHATLGAYQRGPHVGVTTATGRHADLTRYLTEFMKKHCGDGCEFTSITVARDLCTEVHSDRFKLRPHFG